jgi:hypothetical protein
MGLLVQRTPGGHCEKSGLGNQIEHIERHDTNWAWWYMPVTSALGKWRQEDYKFEVNLGLHT